MQATSTSSWLRVARKHLGKNEDVLADEGAESAFTLVELMVVLLVMAVLLAIALPTFLGVQTGAQNRAAQSDLTNAITSGKTSYANSNSYGANSTLAASAIQASEPEMRFSAGAVAFNNNAHDVSIEASSDGQIVVLAAQAVNGVCWYAEDNEEASAVTGSLSNDDATQGITYGSSKGVEMSTCSATDTVSNWGSAYPIS